MSAGKFNRWYDLDIQLSELVRALELLSEESQVLFALLLTHFSNEIIRLRGRAFFSELEWEKLRGIYKSKRGRRWYDQQPALHKAFNTMYSLNDDDKALIANSLYMPARLVKQYEQLCQERQHQPDLDMVCRIVETTFKDGANKAEALYL